MNITIRRCEPEDYEAMGAIFAGPKVVWGSLQIPFPSKEMWRRRLAEPSEGAFELVALVENEIVGQLHLQTFPNRPRGRHAGRIGMAVRDDWQGKGVGSALLKAAIDLADNWLNLTRLELEVFTDNEAAVQLYMKFDFEVEGVLREYGFRNGEYMDVYAMARFVFSFCQPSTLKWSTSLRHLKVKRQIVTRHGSTEKGGLCYPIVRGDGHRYSDLVQSL